MIILLTIIIFVLSIFIYKKYNNLIYFVFSPYFLFTIINTLIYFIAPELLLSILNKKFDHLTEIHTIVFINQLLIFFISYISIKKLPSLSYSNKVYRYNYYDIFIPLFFVSIIIFLLLIYNFITNHGLVDFNEYYKSTRRGGNTWKIYLGYASIYIPFVYLYLTNNLNIRFFILLILSFFSIVLTGARIGILEIVLLLSFYYLYIGKLNKKSLLKIFFISIVFLILMTIIRMSSGDGNQDFIGRMIIFFALSFDMVDHFDKVIEYVSNNGILFGKTLVDLLYFFMPSSIFPEKPLSSEAARLIYSYAAETGVGYNFGMITISYFNFGFVGAVILPLIYFYFLNKFYLKLIFLKYKNKPNFLDFFYFYFMVKIIIMLRLGVMTHFLGLIILQVIFLIFLKFYIEMYIFTFRKKLLRGRL